jgi:hypothetical protein
MPKYKKKSRILKMGPYGLSGLAWPGLIRNTRNIGDFQRWKTHDVYQQAFDRLLRDMAGGVKKH